MAGAQSQYLNRSHDNCVGAKSRALLHPKARTSPRRTVELVADAMHLIVFAPRQCSSIAFCRACTSRPITTLKWFTTCITCLARLDLRHGPAGTARALVSDPLRLLHSRSASAAPSNTFITPCAQNKMRVMNTGTEHWNRTEAKQNDGALP